MMLWFWTGWLCGVVTEAVAYAALIVNGGPHRTSLSATAVTLATHTLAGPLALGSVFSAWLFLAWGIVAPPHVRKELLGALAGEDPPITLHNVLLAQILALVSFLIFARAMLSYLDWMVDDDA